MAWTISPGRPFWSFVVAFCSNMTALFAADKFALYVDVDSWLAATIMSVFVGGVMYGKAKLDETKPTS